MDNLIITEENHGVFTITLNRAEKKNALNNLMYQQLCQAFLHASQTNSIHCVLIRGNQSCFCAGNDFQDFIETRENDELAAFNLIKILVDFNKPLVAAVAGPAIGIGTTLLLHCDMVIAASNSKFQLPFTKLGLCPEAGSSLLLPMRIGHVKAFELLVLGKSFNAEQALQYGLINQSCSDDELFHIAEHVAQTIANLPLDAVKTSRQLMRQATTAVLPQLIADEAEQFARLMNTEECKSILSKFFN